MTAACGGYREPEQGCGAQKANPAQGAPPDAEHPRPVQGDAPQRATNSPVDCSLARGGFPYGSPNKTNPNLTQWTMGSDLLFIWNKYKTSDYTAKKFVWLPFSYGYVKILLI